MSFLRHVHRLWTAVRTRPHLLGGFALWLIHVIVIACTPASDAVRFEGVLLIGHGLLLVLEIKAALDENA